MDDTWSVQRLAEELLRLFPNMGRQVSAFLRDSGEEETTLMQIGVLHQIKNRSITASELAKQRRVSLQSASVLVQGMVERGLIVRVPDPTDRRQFLLQVTPEGFAKAEATRHQLVNYLTDLLGDLTAQEVGAAQLFLPALTRILAKHSTADPQQQDIQHAPREEQTIP
ncbi:MAG: MarR family transcriptional regulator [Anaerolineae bacterium]|nr:MarR family transcriptional regulator [Anaerolineae bacterium]